MSILDAFDSNPESILPPTHIANPVENCPETFVVTFKENVIDLIRQNYGAEEISFMGAGGIRVPVYRFRYAGKWLGCYHTLLGGPASVGLLEEMLVKGAKKILMFGSCGTLDESLSAGHLILPSEAYRDEGTSYHYMPPSDYVEIATAPRLKAILDGLGIPCVMGRVWTTDAFYRETADHCRKRREEGCIAVEMECASMAACSRFRGAEFYQFLYAADCVAETVWEARLLGKMPASGWEKYLRIALEAAIRL